MRSLTLLKKLPRKSLLRLSSKSSRRLLQKRKKRQSKLRFPPTSRKSMSRRTPQKSPLQLNLKKCPQTSRPSMNRRRAQMSLLDSQALAALCSHPGHVPTAAHLKVIATVLSFVTAVTTFAMRTTSCGSKKKMRSRQFARSEPKCDPIKWSAEILATLSCSAAACTSRMKWRREKLHLLLPIGALMGTEN